VGFFDKVKAGVGMDTASLEVDIQQRPSKRGDVLQALIHVKPGKAAQKMNYLYVSCLYEGEWAITNADGHAIHTIGKAYIWRGNLDNSEVQLEPGQPLQFPVQFTIPSDSPLSNDKLKYEFYVRADIAEAKDPKNSVFFDITA
jgi:sporulation-control protein spo0M